MHHSKKKAVLFIEFPVFVFSLLVILFLMVMLHLVVTFAPNQEREGFQNQWIAQDYPHFFLQGFLNQKISDETKSELINEFGEFDGGVHFNRTDLKVRDILTHRDKEFAVSFFEMKKDEYIKNNQQSLNTFYNYLTSQPLFESGRLQIPNRRPLLLNDYNVMLSNLEEYFLEIYYIEIEEVGETCKTHLEAQVSYLPLEQLNQVVVIDFLSPNAACRAQVITKEDIKQ